MYKKTSSLCVTLGKIQNYKEFFGGILNTFSTLFIFLILLFVFILGGGRDGFSKEIVLDYTNSQNVFLNILDIKLAEKYRQSHVFVSITSIDKGIYLIANYSEIFKFDSHTGLLTKMHASSNGGAVRGYNPTGVFYSKNRQLLYVANYNFNNILIFSVDITDNKLSLNGEIKSKNTIGPENVFVSNDEKFVAIANYNGGSVSLFERKKDEFVELWDYKIPQVHGVCIQHDNVYATGLASRKIYKIDIKTGIARKSLGTLHSDPEKNGFMWPTSIFPLDQNRLIVSDAHTGYIYVLNSDTLKISGYFGGNGPTFQYLHMPYAVIADEHDFVILSTFQDRIIKVKIKGWNVEKNYFFKEKNWNSVSIEKFENHLRDYDTYIYRKGPLVKILDKDYNLGFGHLYPVESNLPVIRFPNVATLNNNNSYIYFTDAVSVSSNEQVLISDKSLMAFYVYDKTNGLQYTVPFRINETDNWVIDNKIVSSSGVFNLDEVVPLMHEKIKSVNKARRANGLLDYNDYWNILYNNPKVLLFYSPAVFIEKLKALFKSKEGISFFENYLVLLQDRNANRNNVQELANTFYTSFLNNTYSDYNELVSVQMLTDAPIKRSTEFQMSKQEH